MNDMQAELILPPRRQYRLLKPLDAAQAGRERLLAPCLMKLHLLRLDAAQAGRERLLAPCPRKLHLLRLDAEADLARMRVLKLWPGC